MKKLLSMAALSLAAALLAVSQWACANPQNTNTNSVIVATPESTPDKTAIAAEITRIENDWPRIIKEHDAAAVKRIEADDAVFVYPDGTTGDKAQDFKDMESGALSADSWVVTELKINVLDNDSAVASGRSSVKGGKYKTADGKTQDISGEYRWIDTYVRRNGQWQIVAGATTPIMKGTMAAPSPTPKASPGASPATKPTPAPATSPAMKPMPMKTKTP